MPGPLPQQQRRRRNAATIPTTTLPAGGRPGSPPRVPKWVSLGAMGKEWWRWAWRTPQAAGWASGHEAIVARRASLEDDVAALAEVDGLDFAEVLDAESAKAAQDAVRRVAALATGRLALFREMREIDDRLGLTPRGMAALRWTITEEESAPAKPGVVVPGRWQSSGVG